MTASATTQVLTRRAGPHVVSHSLSSSLCRSGCAPSSSCPTSTWARTAGTLRVGRAQLCMSSTTRISCAPKNRLSRTRTFSAASSATTSSSCARSSRNELRGHLDEHTKFERHDGAPDFSLQVEDPDDQQSCPRHIDDSQTTRTTDPAVQEEGQAQFSSTTTGQETHSTSSSSRPTSRQSSRIARNGHPPFYVKRTASGNLPIYVFRRNNKSLALTVIRKIRGDIEELKNQLKVVCRGARVSVSENQGLEIHGDYRNVVKSYLEGCGC
ncbi:unnamed protein product [Amoebophrya sp. A25]|nr:unnamed protein product [Amoebophrya sp. A25]|eukprot:GSA25T00003712001.1